MLSEVEAPPREKSAVSKHGATAKVRAPNKSPETLRAKRATTGRRNGWFSIGFLLRVRVRGREK